MAQAEPLGSRVQIGLSMEELVAGVGARKVAHHNVGPFDRVMASVAKGIAKRLQQVQRPFVAGGIAIVPHDREDTAARGSRVNRNEITQPHTSMPCLIPEHDVVDTRGIYIAKHVTFVVPGAVGERRLRDIQAWKGITRALPYGNVRMIVIG